MMQKIKVDASYPRLDKFLAEKFSENSRSYWQKAINASFVLVNGHNAGLDQPIKSGDRVEIRIPATKIQAIDIPVIYEDENVIALNKPAGVLTHAKGEFNPEPTVASFIEPMLNGPRTNRAGIVHRLDRGTSGVIICAKNVDAQKHLQKQFSTRKVEKTYLAVVSGELKPKEAIIDLPIGRNPKKPQTFRVMAGGKTAQTHYKVLSTVNRNSRNYSLIQLTPKTGRTHQLRVHLAYIKAPILGDRHYGGEDYERLMLHAAELKIKLPRGAIKHFKAAPPPAFKVFK